MRFVRTAENIWGLPTGFTRCEYLQSTGTQYIDTDLAPNENQKIELRGFKAGGGSTSGGYIACGSTATSNDRIQIWAEGGGLIWFRVDGTSVTANESCTVAHKIVLDIKNKKGYVDSSEYNLSYSGSLTTYQYFLFLRNDGGTAGTTYNAPMRLYYVKIWDNDTLVRDFIPCIDPLGVPCMYDLVEKKPYYNAGTGTFTVGRQVIPVEYLESSGTQWLKTDYTLTANTKIDIAFSPNQQTTANLWVIGSYVASNKLTGVRITDGTTIDCYINTTISKKVSGSNIGNKYQAVLDGKWTVNGSEGTAVTVSAGLSPLTLFGWNASTTANSYAVSGICSTKIYYCKIWDNGKLVRDFIPVRDENNVGFMFDKVSGTCYLNAGTGSFSVGENKYTSKLRLIKDAIRIPEGYTRVEYLESTGTQYIDTGILPSEDLRTKVVQAYTGTSIARNSSIFGSNGYNVNNRYWINYDRHFEIGYGDFLATDVVVQPDEVNTIDFNYIKNGSHYFSFNGIEYTSSGTPNTQYSIVLFGRVVSTQTPILAPQRIYKVQFIRNNVIIGNFIPVRDSNNVGYMFDEVTGQMFGNAGSGSFGIGNDLPTAKVRFIQDVLPREYRPLKYLESSGTQYIDTGYSFNSNTDEIELYYQNMSTLANKWLFGSYEDNANIGISSANLSQVTFWYKGNVWGAVSSQYNSEHILRYDSTGMSNDGINLKAFTSYSGTWNLYLFALNNTGTSPNGYYGYGKVWRYTHKRNGVPVRDLYPALRKSDNKPGMYDRITKQFFVNQGTGEFNYEI